MSQDQKKDGSDDILWITGAVVAILVGVWFFFDHELKSFYLTLKLMQLKTITILFPFPTLLEYIYLIEHNLVEKWRFEEIASVGATVGYFVNTIPALLVGYWGFNVWDKNPSKKYKRVLNMKSLKQSEVVLWPYIAPVIDIDFMKEDFFKGPFAMAMKPYNFAVKYRLLLEEKNVGSLDKTKASKLFVSQLGRPNNGIASLKKHEKAFIAICAAHGLGFKDEALDAINKIALSARPTPLNKMPNFDSCNGLYKYLDNEEVQRNLQKSAYVYPMIMFMIEFARSTGVFPPSFFVWMKPRDRVLWYCIDCVGRDTPYVEVSGIWGHWLAEKVAKHSLPVPYVKNAVAGLELALGEVKVVDKY